MLEVFALQGFHERVKLCRLYLAATSFSAGWPVADSAVLEACNREHSRQSSESRDN